LGMNFANTACVKRRIKNHNIIIMNNKIVKFKVVIAAFLILCLVPDSVKSADVKISWDSNKEDDLAGYVVYYGTRSRMYAYNKDVGNVTECTITALPDTGVYYFSITAYDRAGNESSLSDEAVVFLSKIKKKPFSLFQNYPNPFNPSTKIPYLLSYDLEVNITVYDIRGRKIKVLQKGVQQRGNYEAEWDGTDEMGVKVASGIYICRIIVGEFSQTRKISLIH